RNGNPIGSITVARSEAGPFSDSQIALLRTFADQAVIAIENARLLTELQARNRDLSESLDRQTATAEILRVISQSQTDVQSVFEVIAVNSLQLCAAWSTTVWLVEADRFRAAASAGGAPGSSEYQRQRSHPVAESGYLARCLAERRVVAIE